MTAHAHPEIQSTLTSNFLLQCKSAKPHKQHSVEHRPRFLTNDSTGAHFWGENPRRSKDYEKIRKRLLFQSSNGKITVNQSILHTLLTPSKYSIRFDGNKTHTAMANGSHRKPRKGSDVVSMWDATYKDRLYHFNLADENSLADHRIGLGFEPTSWLPHQQTPHPLPISKSF